MKVCKIGNFYYCTYKCQYIHISHNKKKKKNNMQNPQKTTSLLSQDSQSPQIPDYHPNHPQYHITSGEYLKSFVYGGLDGAVNTLAVILGGIAAGTSPAQIVGFCLSVIIGDGIGMGLGDYLSAKAEKEYIRQEEKREIWEFQNKYDVEIAEVVEIYTNRGYDLDQTRRLVDLFATSKPAFINIMMLEELGLVKDDSNPLANGFITFLAFMVFGSLPLVPYLIGYYIHGDNTSQYMVPCLIIAGVLFLILGIAKGVLIRQRILLSGLETLVLGGIAIGAGYGIGLLFEA